MSQGPARPAWSSELLPHISLTTSQIERLEIIRRHVGATDAEFSFHIRTHPECTKMLQRLLYRRLREEESAEPEVLTLVRIILSRLQTAMRSGDDLFGLKRYAGMNSAQASPELVSAIIELLRARAWTTIEHVAQGIVDEEANLPDVVPASEGAQEAAHQITLILAERGGN